jgi:hypothetical protein
VAPRKEPPIPAHEADDVRYPDGFFRPSKHGTRYAHPVRLEGGFRVGMWIDLRAGIAVVVGVEIDHPNGEPITTATLRELALQNEVSRFLREHREFFESADEESQYRWSRNPMTCAALRDVEDRPGRRGHPDTYHAELAYDYLKIVRSGSRKPVEQLAERRGWTTARVRDGLNIARDRELLTPAPAGKAGGQLTPAGWDLLDERDHRRTTKAKTPKARARKGRSKARRQG